MPHEPSPSDSPPPPGVLLGPTHMSENGGPLNITVGPSGASRHLQPQQQQQHYHQAITPANHTYSNSNSSNNARLSVRPTSLQDVRLTITWLHHSSARILETVRPSLVACRTPPSPTFATRTPSII
ncbi:uncharacterized protein PG998_014422 [Apiospora kogelbergensis]|uniref:uncharacterized protein n=1 Tax=Apiospora kogelbergensis TaxID=1337665 RepID=UPI00312F6F4B